MNIEPDSERVVREARKILERYVAKSSFIGSHERTLSFLIIEVCDNRMPSQGNVAELLVIGQR